MSALGNLSRQGVVGGAGTPINHRPLPVQGQPVGAPIPFNGSAQTAAVMNGAPVRPLNPGVAPQGPYQPGQRPELGSDIHRGPGVFTGQTRDSIGNSLRNYWTQNPGSFPDNANPQFDPNASDANAPVYNAEVSPQPYGLSGAESSINAGLNAGISALEAGSGRAQRNIDRAINRGMAPLENYQGAGGRANDLRADLTGANGPEAAARAFEAYKSSPGYQYQIDESERALTRNAAATGGLAGGNVLKALQANATGLASQDFQNSFNRLSGVADSGMQANQIGANLAGTDASLSGNVDLTTGLRAAGMFENAGTNIGAHRYNTGTNLANTIQDTAGGMADLTDRQGTRLSDTMQQDVTNMSNILTSGGTLNADQLNQLSTILANLTTGNATNQAQIDAAAGRSQAAGITDSAAGQRTGINTVADLVALLWPNGAPQQNQGNGGYDVYGTSTQDATYGNF